MKDKNIIIATITVFLLLLGHSIATARQRTAAQVKEIVENSPLRGKNVVAKSQSFAKTSAEWQAEPYYVFEAADNEGFVIVSGDERMAPVLGYALKGNFDLANAPTNVKDWLQAYEQEYQQLQKVESNGTIKGNSFTFTASGEVKPFLLSKWGQTTPFNNLCPEYKEGQKSATGCVATAMAQLMYYYKYPAVGHGDNSYISSTHGFDISWNYDAHPLQWDLIKDTYTDKTYTAEQSNAIAELLYGCGVAVNMDYDEESSATQYDEMVALHKYYGYDEDMAIIRMDAMATEDWHATLLAELEAKRPLMVSATTIYNAGHAFLIHGYTIDTDGQPYYDVNWGWEGSYDGQFKMPNLCYDGVAENAFSQDIRVLIGVQPDDGVRSRTFVMQAKHLLPNAEKIDLTKGERLNVEVSGLTVGSIGDFHGTISLALVDNANNVYTIHTFSDVTFRGTNTYYYTADCSIPSSISSGDYSLKCFVRPEGSSDDVEVMVGIVPEKIEIFNDENVYYAQLSAFNVAVEHTGSRNFTLTAENIMNTVDNPFTGTLQMLLTDTDNNSVVTFGTTATRTNLGKYSYIPKTDTFVGTLPDNIPDGAYRVWLGAQQSGYAQWNNVTGYEQDGSYITKLDIDAYTPIWVIDGQVSMEAPRHTVTFRVDDEIVSQQKLAAGELIGIPEVPEKEGYTFSGWSEVPDVMPDEDLEFDAYFIVNSYKLTYLVNGVVYKELIVEYGAPITPEDVPNDDDHNYTWDFVPATMPAHDVEVNAIITAVRSHVQESGEVEIFTLDGQRIGTLQKGINIIRTPNGKTKKVIVR
ncbi:MAG: C10 family peptidase [Prevotellaceae bacterium]|nr:C10 family peptidase [Prevotellaceae bacterium]